MENKIPWIYNCSILFWLKYNKFSLFKGIIYHFQANEEDKEDNEHLEEAVSIC